MTVSFARVEVDAFCRKRLFVGWDVGFTFAGDGRMVGLVDL
jgi:hypothetical protein